MRVLQISHHYNNKTTMFSLALLKINGTKRSSVEKIKILRMKWKGAQNNSIEIKTPAWNVHRPSFTQNYQHGLNGKV